MIRLGTSTFAARNRVYGNLLENYCTDRAELVVLSMTKNTYSDFLLTFFSSLDISTIYETVSTPCCF